jgi:hypothetical protein
MISVYLLLHRVRPPVRVEDAPHGLQEQTLRPFDVRKLGFGMVHRIAQHCICDRVHFTELWDVLRIIPEDDPYRPVIEDVAWAMRSSLANEPFDRAAYERTAEACGGRPGLEHLRE